MTNVVIGDEGFVVDAATVAEAFGLSPPEIQPMMRSGAITSRCEKGVDEDAGRWRLEGKDYVVQDGDVIHFRFNV